MQTVQDVAANPASVCALSELPNDSGSLRPLTLHASRCVVIVSLSSSLQRRMWGITLGITDKIKPTCLLGKCTMEKDHFREGMETMHPLRP